MHRFFVTPEVLARQPVLLSGAQAHQIRRVLRLRPGDRVTLLDNHGWAYEAVLIACGETDAMLQTDRRWTAEGEPRTHITLFQAVLKGEQFGWALQKGTEVGVSRFVPMVCERNVVSDLDAVEQKRGRWERIIREAAEQSGRGRLPELAPAQPFARAVCLPPPTDSGLRRLIPWEGERVTGLRDALVGCNFARGARIQIFVGPEGGFTEEEVWLAQRAGVQPVTLGPRILRGETAGIVAAAVVLYEAGELALQP
jgi:16S rRNA (uracil1498-N3)-methyltransferase